MQEEISFYAAKQQLLADIEEEDVLTLDDFEFADTEDDKYTTLLV